jgi:hypothetical protein
VLLYWTVQDSEGIAGFQILDSPTCWGPFTPQAYVPNYGIGDYWHQMVTPHLRTYYLKLVVIGNNGQTSTYTASAAPSVGTTVPDIPTPSRVWLDAHIEDAELSWDRLVDPLVEGQVYYWIYRGIGEDLAECGYGGAWGNWYRGGVQDGYGPATDRHGPVGPVGMIMT